MGIMGAFFAGAAGQGLEAIKTNEANDLAAQKEARLREWKVADDEKLAQRELARDNRTAAREEVRWTEQGKRENERWTAQGVREDARTAAQIERDRVAADAAQKRHDDNMRIQEQRLTQQAERDRMNNERLLRAITARGSSGDKAEDNEVKRLIDVAKAYTDAGNTAEANQVLNKIRTMLIKPPPNPAENPGGAAAPAPKSGAGPSSSKAEAAPSPAMMTDPNSPAGKFQARQRQAESARPAEAADAAKEALYLLEQGDPLKLYDFQQSRKFDLLDRATKAEISKKVLGKK